MEAKTTKKQKLSKMGVSATVGKRVIKSHRGRQDIVDSDLKL